MVLLRHLLQTLCQILGTIPIVVRAGSMNSFRVIAPCSNRGD